jgi:predicted phosphodiesterase
VRTALISDIHGNAFALDAVLAELEADQVICLGDAVQGGPQPAEVLDRLRNLGCPVVLGNADAFLLDPEAGPERFLEIREWTLAQLAPDHLEQIRGFEPRVEADLGDGRTLLAFHGAPDDYDEILWPWSPTAEFTAVITGQAADVYAGGHVHQQFVRRLADALFVNPGSVGQSWDGDRFGEPDLKIDHFAGYAVLEERSLEFHRVPFDPSPLRELYLKSGMPRADESLRQWGLDAG